MDYSKLTKYGVYRFDYNDGGLAGRWNHYYNGNFDEELTADINKLINDTVKQFNSLEAIQKYCKGFSYNDTKLIEGLESKLCRYCIRLYPSKGDYNGYIYVYAK